MIAKQKTWPQYRFLRAHSEKKTLYILGLFFFSLTRALYCAHSFPQLLTHSQTCEKVNDKMYPHPAVLNINPFPLCIFVRSEPMRRGGIEANRNQIEVKIRSANVSLCINHIVKGEIHLFVFSKEARSHSFL